MPQSLYLHEQAHRCRRLARGSTDPSLRESLMKLADEFAARANAQENHGTTHHSTVRQAGREDQGER